MGRVEIGRKKLRNPPQPARGPGVAHPFNEQVPSYRDVWCSQSPLIPKGEFDIRGVFPNPAKGGTCSLLSPSSPGGPGCQGFPPAP